MRSILASCILASCILVVGCSDTKVEHASQFVGTWAIEETVAHAENGAAVYELGADGGVTRTFVTDGYPYPQVSSDDPQTITCVPGSAWHSIDDLLVLEGACSDGIVRDIAIQFVSDDMQNLDGGTVELQSVDGESSWREPMWGWSFTRCIEATCGGVLEPSIET
ncbi:MAG: hypothetical protein AB7O24_08935 [Kofleriaceae bacterium]